MLVDIQWFNHSTKSTPDRCWHPFLIPDGYHRIHCQWLQRISRVKIRGHGRIDVDLSVVSPGWDSVVDVITFKWFIRPNATCFWVCTPATISANVENEWTSDVGSSPNITGEIWDLKNNSNDNAIGAFYIIDSWSAGKQYSAVANDRAGNYGFAASRSSSLFSGATLQPSALTVSISIRF